MSSPHGPSALPRISVVIAAYNAAATLGETLRSLEAQSLRPMEIVVVDDGSTDGTWELLEACGSPIRAFRQANSGIGAARNRGMREAQGDFIALLDADDVCDPARLQLQFEYLSAHPDVLLCSTDFSSFDASGLLERSSIGSYYSRCSPRHGGVRARYQEQQSLVLPVEACGLPAGETVECHSGQVFDQMMLGNFIHPGTSMFRREALDAAGNFDPAIRIACEWEWLVRVTRAGRVGYIDLPLLGYRRSPGQISSSPGMNLDSLLVARMIHQRYAGAHSPPPDAVRRQLGNLELQAAYALAPVQRGRAVALLASSVFRHRVLNGVSLRTLVRVLLPAGALHRLRAARRRLRSPA